MNPRTEPVPATTPPGTGPRRTARRVGAALLTAGLLGAGSQVLAPAAAQAVTPPAPTTVVFGAGTANRPFTVPPGVTRLDVTAIGAAGGGYVESLWPYTKAPNAGGAGAKVTGTLKVTPGQQLYVNVASVPVNGDGAAGLASWWWRIPSGGAASDIRTSPTAPLTGDPGSDPRLIVAAGGGSVGGEGDAPGGDAGPVPAAGSNGTYQSCGGGPGTATAGGRGGAANGCGPGGPGSYLVAGSDGTAGAGGAGAVTPDPGCHDSTNRPAGGMGGSGWFGGGGGGAGSYCSPGGGGAGSSYASAAFASNVAVTTDTARDTPQVTIGYTPVIPGSPVFDTGGNYVWRNGSTLDLPYDISVPSPRGTHQQSCSTLGAKYFGNSMADYTVVTLQPWSGGSATAPWSRTGYGVAHLRLTTDGNLQYVTDNQVWWSSNTAPQPGQPYAVNLKLQTDGNLALYSAGGQYLWDAKVAPVCP